MVTSTVTERIGGTRAGMCHAREQVIQSLTVIQHAIVYMHEEDRCRVTCTRNRWKNSAMIIDKDVKHIKHSKSFGAFSMSFNFQIYFQVQLDLTSKAKI